MKINPQNLEAKYALELYPEVPGFPSKRDRIYATIRGLEDQDMLDVTFPADHVWGVTRHCYGAINELRKFLDEVSSPDTCPPDELILEKVKQEKRGHHYKLIRNPWM